MRFAAARRSAPNGCITPAPAGHTPGSALTRRLMCLPCGVSVSHTACGMVLRPPPSGSHGAPYSTLGRARISRLRFGVAPCQARLSRNTPAPAGAPTRVERRIHSGSCSGGTGRICQVCEPGICRMGPFSHVRSHMAKLMVTTGGVKSTTWRRAAKVGSPDSFSVAISSPSALAVARRASEMWCDSPTSACRCWYSTAPGRQRSPPAPSTK